MEGTALVHVDKQNHPDFHGKLRLFANTPGLPPGATIARIRPVWRLHPPTPRGYDDFNVFIEVTAQSQNDLRLVFALLEAQGCHIDGYGG